MARVEPTSDLAVERSGSTIFVTFNRPALRNALNEAMWLALRDIAQALTRDGSVRSVILRGAGGHFCGGGDLRERTAIIERAFEDGEDPLEARSRMEAAIVRQFEALPQLVISAVHGVVAGAGMGFVCVSDIVIAESASIFMTPEVRRGFPPGQILPFVVKRVGQSNARYVLLGGGKMSAAMALRIGLIHEVVEGSAVFEERVAELLTEIRYCEPRAIAATKALMADVGKPDYLQLAARIMARSIRSEQGREGEAAFMEKRSPSWADDGNP